MSEYVFLQEDVVYVVWFDKRKETPTLKRHTIKLYQQVKAMHMLSLLYQEMISKHVLFLR